MPEFQPNQSENHMQNFPLSDDALCSDSAIPNSLAVGLTL